VLACVQTLKRSRLVGDAAETSAKHRTRAGCVVYSRMEHQQRREYYPFGLQTSSSWTRENNKNDYLYNAANELNSKTGWYEMFFRGYDPALGRMLQVDPLAARFASHNPYNYAVNNPSMFNDPYGAQAEYVPGMNYNAWRRSQPNSADIYSGDWAEDFWNETGGGGTFVTVVTGGHLEVSGPNAKGDVSSEWVDHTTNVWVPGEDHPGTNDPSNSGNDPGCPPNIDCARLEKAAKDGLGLKKLSFVIGVTETNYGVWERSYDHKKYPTTQGKIKTIYKPDGTFRSARAAQFAMYSRSTRGAGIGLSALNLGISGYLMWKQAEQGEPVDLVSAVQVTVGGVGLGASLLNAAGIGVAFTGPIAATTGVFGIVLSIPGNWYMVYRGAYEMEYIATPYYPSDSEIFGGN
jgi:RHS repeat-associated protein